MIIPPQKKSKIILVIALLTQLTGYYFLFDGMIFLYRAMNGQSEWIKSHHFVIAFAFMYFYSFFSFACSGGLAILLKRHEKRLSPYLVATLSAPAIMLFVIFVLWRIVIKL